MFWFWIDLLSIFPGEHLGLNSLRMLRFVRVLRLAKLLRVLRSGSMLQRWENQININYFRVTLCSLLFSAFLLVHIMACAFVIVEHVECAGHNGDEGCVNWISFYFMRQGRDDESSTDFEIWVIAVYWAVATISTLGYGDVFPVTDLERVYVTIATLIGVTVYSYGVGSICAKVAALDGHDTAFFSQMDALNLFIAEKELSNEIAKRLRAFFRYQQLYSKENWLDIVEQMSPALQVEVFYTIHRTTLHGLALLESSPRAFYARVAAALKFTHLSRGEIIYNTQDPATHLFIIDYGLVFVQIGFVTRIMEAGRSFGDDAMYNSVRTLSSAATVANVTLLSLEISTLFEIMKEFPEVERKVRLRIKRLRLRRSLGEFVHIMNLVSSGDWTSVQAEASLKPETLPLFYLYLEETYTRKDPTFRAFRRIAARRIARWYYHILQGLEVTCPKFQLKKLLWTLGLKEHIYLLVENEKIEINTCRQLSIEGLRIIGIPLGHCVRIKVALSPTDASTPLVQFAPLLDNPFHFNKGRKATAHTIPVNRDSPNSIRSTPTSYPSKLTYSQCADVMDRL
ncbi:hypothetical protein CYMTET_11144 [Cymbomonas tetramitiformis]|uniref:Cyclic nucleotide-binding domain-containing protein n=1 Tax=Cymbomonas tetramitiformis TaxID=36881 RepID=A0AAE0GMW9_9CHLO|nr:hypothetical protein CYMTET_11144 [Cymbomonas tetramitiformis]